MSAVHRLAARLGMTEGQAYTLLVVLLTVGLLLPSLRSLNTLPAERLAAPVPVPMPVAVAPSPDAGGAPTAGGDTATLPGSAELLTGGSGLGTLPPLSAPRLRGPAPRLGPPEPGRPPAAAVVPGPVDLVLDALGPVSGLGAHPSGDLLVAAGGTAGKPAQIARVTTSGDIVSRWPLGSNPRETVLGGLWAGTAGAYAIEVTSARLMALDYATGRLTAVVRIPDLPLCAVALATDACQQGVLDTAPALADVTVDGGGNVLVTDGGQGVIWRVPAAGGLELWHQSVEYASPGGLAGIDASVDGVVYVVSRDRAATGPFARSTVYAIAVDDAGSPVTRTPFAVSEVGTTWLDLLVASPEDVVVSAPAAGALVVLGGDGLAKARITEVDESPLAHPSALASRGTALLLADNVPAGDDVAPRLLEFSLPAP